MSEARLDILTMGTLARNRFWDEKSDVREELATVSLVRSGDAVVVVDPGWPAEVLTATLFYRAGLKPEAVTHVFLTHVDPAHARGIAVFDRAQWLAYGEEIVYAKADLSDDPDVARIIGRLADTPERLAPGVDIFPTPGHSPGHTSLMVNTPMSTTLLAGDAVLSRDHLEQGDLGPMVFDRDRAEASFREILELADFVVPGHDNLVWLRSGFNFL
jgi:glyoxylase-like metal-dependent hydrolase (beta-lactamase superfamily II)